MNAFKFSLATIFIVAANLQSNEPISGKDDQKIEINGKLKLLYAHVCKAQEDPIIGQIPVVKYNKKENSFKFIGTVQNPEKEGFLYAITRKNWVYIPDFTTIEIEKTKEFAKVGLLVIGTDEVEKAKEWFSPKAPKVPELPKAKL